MIHYVAEYEQMSTIFTELYPDVPVPKNTWQWVASASIASFVLVHCGRCLVRIC
jgi:hypothetical protein